MKTIEEIQLEYTSKMRGKGIGGYQKPQGDNNEWLTPPEIITSLGEFDLDPCAPIVRPWDTALKHYTEEDDGLSLPWNGRVWLNPPYNRYGIEYWMSKMARHLNGTALLYTRTDTSWFQNFVFPFAESMLFIRGRLHFHRVNGERSKINCGGPTILISYSDYDSMMIEQSGIEGKHVLINSTPVIIVDKSPSWKKVVSICLVRLNGEAKLSEIYEMANIVADDKTSKNKHYKEKIRQQLQKHFKRTGRGQYKLMI